MKVSLAYSNVIFSCYACCGSYERTNRLKLDYFRLQRCACGDRSFTRPGLNLEYFCLALLWFVTSRPGRVVTCVRSGLACLVSLYQLQVVVNRSA